MNDPFAGNPWDDTPSTTVQETPAVTTTAPITVNATAEAKVVVTLKGGRDFDAPWIVIHATDVQDAIAQLNNDLVTLMDKTRNAAAHFAGKPQGGQPQAQAPAQAERPAPAGRPAGATQAPEGTKPEFCAHGEMTFKSGVGKSNGKPWKAFMCPAPRGTEQCKPKFL